MSDRVRWVAGDVPGRWRLLAWAVLFIWLLPGLLGHEPWKPDEAYTFGLVNHIMRSGDWVVPTLAGEPFMEKPPFYFICAAFNARVFHPLLSLPDAARLTSAWFLLLTYCFVALSARQLYGKGSGLYAVLLLTATLGLVVRAHQLLTDIAMLSGIAMALYGMVLARQRWLVGGLALGTGAGVAFLSKGVLGPGLIGLGALLLLAHPAWRTREYALAMLTGTLAVMPWLLIWPIALYQRSPQLFDQWFWVNNIGRFVGSVHLGPPATPGFYPRTLLWAGLPTLPLALFALWRVGWRNALADPVMFLPLSQFAVMLAVLSLAADARALYALPMYVPLAVLAVAGLRGMSAKANRRISLLANGLFGVLLLLLWVVWLVGVSGVPGVAHDALAVKHPLEALRVSWSLLLPAILATGTWLWITLKAPLTAHFSLALRLAAGLATSWLLVMTLLLPVIDAEKSYDAMCRGLAKALPAAHGCISSVLLGEPQRALFEYYLGIQTVSRAPTEIDEHCDLVLVQEHDLAGRRHADFGTLIWRGHRPGDERESYALYRFSVADSASD